MVNVIKEQKGDILIVRLSGSIEESANFDQLIGPTPNEVHVYTKEVPRINSTGVKAWIKYFTVLQANGVKLKFFECSTCVVQQVNLISNFICGGTVESIYVPFACGSCSAELVGLFPCETLKTLGNDIPDQKCTKCGSAAAFDDIPEEYFAFLKREQG
ncbi:MAG: hypothetical protein HY072_07105 [Deltaproteobacteria bacterium]|nr:hypothetical protein [Deltaproteobacteria bacterium]